MLAHQAVRYIYRILQCHPKASIMIEHIPFRFDDFDGPYHCIGQAERSPKAGLSENCDINENRERVVNLARPLRDKEDRNRGLSRG